MRKDTMTGRLAGTLGVVVVGLLVSGAIHLFLTPHHLSEDIFLGLGFVSVGAAQVLLGLACLRRPNPVFWHVGVMLTVFSLSVYASSRTLGLPFGHTHEPEAIGALDVIAKGAELATLGGLAMLMIGSVHGPATRFTQVSRSSYHLLIELIVLGIFAAFVVVRLGAAILPQEEPDHHSGSFRQPRTIAWTEARP